MPFKLVHGCLGLGLDISPKEKLLVNPSTTKFTSCLSGCLATSHVITCGFTRRSGLYLNFAVEN